MEIVDKLYTVKADIHRAQGDIADATLYLNAAKRAERLDEAIDECIMARVKLRRALEALERIL